MELVILDRVPHRECRHIIALTQLKFVSITWNREEVSGCKDQGNGTALQAQPCGEILQDKILISQHKRNDNDCELS